MYDLAKQLEHISSLAGKEMEKGLDKVDEARLKELLICQKMVLESMMMVKHINNDLVSSNHKTQYVSKGEIVS